MKRHLLMIAVVLTALAGPSAFAAHAAPDLREYVARNDRDERSARRHHRKGVLTRDEAVRRAQQRHGGRVLSVDLLQSEQAPARYRVKLLSEDGNVRTVDVDALEE